MTHRHRMSDTYCLHVRDDGSELHFRRAKPQRSHGNSRPRGSHSDIDKNSLPFYVVTVAGHYEYTVTSNLRSGRFAPLVTIPPRGEGWELWDSTSDKQTVWRRQIRKMKT